MKIDGEKFEKYCKCSIQEIYEIINQIRKDYKWYSEARREHKNRCHGYEDVRLESGEERLKRDLETAEEALNYLTRKKQGEPDRLITIICSCGNKREISINEEDRCHRIENQNSKFEFTHVYNGNAGLICSQCGNKLVWY